MKPDRAGQHDGAARVRAKPVAIVFLLIWLALLTTGIFYVGGALRAGPEAGAAPMIAWLAVAALGWLFGARLLWRAFRGRPMLRPRPAPQGPQPPRENGPGESDRGFD